MFKRKWTFGDDEGDTSIMMKSWLIVYDNQQVIATNLDSQAFGDPHHQRFRQSLRIGNLQQIAKAIVAGKCASKTEEMPRRDILQMNPWAMAV